MAGGVNFNLIVNKILESITYTNTSDAPPSSVQLDYTMNDGGGQGSGGALTPTVTVNITPVNDAPVASNDTVSTGYGTATSGLGSTLKANDTDADGDTLTITAVGSATHGTIALNGGDPIFTPAAQFSGARSSPLHRQRRPWRHVHGFGDGERRCADLRCDLHRGYHGGGHAALGHHLRQRQSGHSDHVQFVDRQLDDHADE